MPTKSARKSARWRLKPYKKQTKGQTKLAILALLLVFSIIFIGGVVRFTQNLFKPKLAVNSKKGLWDGSLQINLVLKTDNTSLFSYDPNDGSVKVVTIPDETYVNVGTHGSWQIRSVYNLGQSENPPQGVGLLESAVSDFFGLPVDGFIEVEGKSPKEAISILRQSPFSAIGKLNGIKTDLAPIELFRLYSGVAGARFDKLTYFDLTQADANQIDDFVAKNLYDSKLHQEQVPVAVFNGTKLAGKASRAARMITNLGGNVIIQNNFDTDSVDNSFIYTKGDSYTKKRLKPIFSSDCQDGHFCDKLTGELYSRADINIILGSDF